VYLDGGDGGRGDRQGIGRAIVGSRDFICVNLPLFKRAYNTNDGELVSVDDFQTVSGAYRVMLQKLIDAVPNITPERSAFGGFSNGAHTTGLLVAGRDEFILHHFQAFYFAEGGAFLAANAFQNHSMKQLHFLFLHGDYSGSSPGIEGYGFRNLAIEHFAKTEKLDFTTVVMHNTGHEFPPKYMAIAGQWIRGGKISNTEKE
jgi:predicted esterase